MRDTSAFRAPDKSAEELIDEQKSRGGVWLVSRGGHFLETLQGLDPAEMSGPDRLVFVASRKQAAGGIEVHWDNLPVHARLNREGGPVVDIAGQEWPVELRFQPEGTKEEDNLQRLVQFIRDRERQQKDLQQQERARHQQGFMSVPSETSQLLAGAMPQSDKVKVLPPKVCRVEEISTGTGLPGARQVTSRRVTVELDPQTLAESLDSPRRRRSRRKTASLQFPLPGLDRADGPEEDLPGLAMTVLQNLNPDCMLTLLAGMHHALMGDGVFPAAPSVIGRERGMIGKSGMLDSGRRRALQRHFDTLEQVRLLVTPYGQKQSDREASVDQIPLLVRAGTRRIRGKGEVPLFGLAPQIAHRMRTGRCLLMDRRILSADPQKQEWPLRIYWQVFTQLNLNWIPRRLYEVGHMRLGMLDVLSRAGLSWRETQHERGGPAVVERVRQSLAELEQWQGGQPLLHSEIELGESLPQCFINVRPPAGMAAQLTSTRSLAVAHRERAKVLPMPGQKAPKRRAKSG